MKIVSTLMLALLLCAGCQEFGMTKKAPEKKSCRMSEKISSTAVRTDAPPLKFISIIPNFAGNEEYLAKLILNRYERTGITEYAMSYPLHPQGDDVMEKTTIQAQSFHKLKTLLKSKPVKLGILFQTLLGHGGYWNLVPQSGLKGRKSRTSANKETHRFCPYDQNFRAYIGRAVSLLAKEHPDFCLTDDDLRAMKDTCYCTEHVKKISELVGEKLTRKQIKAAVVRASDPGTAENGPVPRLTANPDRDDKILHAFIQSQVDSMDGLCQVVRDALDRVDEKIPCGACLVYRPEYAETQVGILNGKANAPLLRISNGLYLEGAPQTLGYRMGVTGAQAVYYRNKGWTLLDESDTCPHNRYSKSAQTMFQHIAAGIIQGLDGGKLWLDQGAYPLPEISRPYEDILGKYQGFLRELHRVSHSWKNAGLIVRIPPLENGKVTCDDWGGMSFNSMGIPLFYGDLKEDGITMLSGNQVRHLTDAQLKKILSGKAIVDGEAALLLTKRGMSSLLGVKAEEKPVLANSEMCLLTGVSAGFGPKDGTPFLTALKGAEVLSLANFRQYRGAQARTAMPGAVYFENRLGGKIITSSIFAWRWVEMYLKNPCRKRMYLAWIGKLGGVPVYLPAAQHVKLFAGFMPDKSLVSAVFSFAYDPIPLQFVVQKPVKKVFELQAAGDWKEIKFSCKNNIVDLGIEAEPMSVRIFRFQ